MEFCSNIVMENFIMEITDTRIKDLLNIYDLNFKSEKKYLFSSPGRIEIAGNHTDHNNGRVVAAAINLDSLAVVSKNDDEKVNFVSKNLNQFITVDLNDLQKKEYETGKTASLIRGIAAKLSADGYKIGGFDCVVESKVAIGSGLSSSASIEVLIGTIFNNFYNDDKIDAVEIAKIGQYAENNYFGKPCGLMDQLAIACGGIVGIDFLDFEKPVLENINIHFSQHGYALILIETGGSHADLTNDYASITEEMKAVAHYFNEKTLRSVNREQIIKNINELRKKLGDRAILRAFHFLEEDKRAASLLNTIRNGEFNLFLKSVSESGSSSVKWLQNSFSNNDVGHQGISLALELTEYFIKENKIRGAAKVHGGGFAGTILAIIENSVVDEYKSLMKNVFGENAVTRVYVRDSGAARLNAKL